MAKIFGELENASAQNLTVDPTSLPESRLWQNTTDRKLKTVINAIKRIFVFEDATQDLTNKNYYGTSFSDLEQYALVAQNIASNLTPHLALPNDKTLIHLTGTTAGLVEGIAWNGTGSQTVVIHNGTNQDQTLVHESVNVILGIQRLSLPGAINIRLPANTSLSFIRDSNVGRWIVVGGAGGGDSASGGYSFKGSQTLGTDVSEVIVTLPVAFPDTGYCVLLQITNQTDLFPIFLSAIVKAKTTANFTVLFNAPTDSTNYILEYGVAKYG